MINAGVNLSPRVSCPQNSVQMTSLLQFAQKEKQTVYENQKYVFPKICQDVLEKKKSNQASWDNILVNSMSKYVANFVLSITG